MMFTYDIIRKEDKKYDGFFALTIHRKLGRFLAYLFINYLHIRNPNLVTFGSLLVCFLFPIIALFTSYPTTIKLVLISLLHSLRFTLDCTDGIIARATGKISDFGRKFEGFVDGRAEDFYFLSIYLIFRNPFIPILWIIRKIDKAIFLYKFQISVYKTALETVFKKINKNTFFAPDVPDFEDIFFLGTATLVTVLNSPNLFLNIFLFYYIASFLGDIVMSSVRSVFKKVHSTKAT